MFQIYQENETKQYITIFTLNAEALLKEKEPSITENNKDEYERYQELINTR